MKLLLSNFF